MPVRPSACCVLGNSLCEAAQMADPADVLKILVTSDLHLGYNEKDAIRGQDTFNTFDEVRCLLISSLAVPCVPSSASDSEFVSGKPPDCTAPESSGVRMNKAADRRPELPILRQLTNPPPLAVWRRSSG